MKTIEGGDEEKNGKEKRTNELKIMMLDQCIWIGSWVGKK